jgi:hypothetical protein
VTLRQVGIDLEGGFVLGHAAQQFIPLGRRQTMTQQGRQHPGSLQTNSPLAIPQAGPAQREKGSRLGHLEKTH